MLIRKSNLWIYGLITVMFFANNLYANVLADSTKWYVGAFGGYMLGHLTSDDPTHEQSTGDYKDDSPIAGIFVGYNFMQNEDWFASGEIVIPLYIKKGTAVDKQYFPGLVTYEASYKYAIWLAGKYGLFMGNTKPYLFGAVGIVNAEGKTYNVDENDNYSPGFVQSAAATHFIFQVGGGMDFPLSDNMFIGARIAYFIGAKADHTMPWNEPGPNMFGYNAMLTTINISYGL